MMLAQTSVGLEGGQYLAGVLAICVAVLLPLVREFWKDRRERRSDELSQGYLKSIAASNTRLADEQSKLNVVMVTSVAVNTERHNQNIEAMKHVCRCASCENFESKQHNPPTLRSGAAGQERTVT